MMAFETPYELIRPDDLLVLRIELRNLRPSDDGLRFERVDPAAPATIIFTLPGQHITEQSFLEFKDSKAPTTPPPRIALLAAPSRIAFTVPDGVADLPCTVSGLLDWAGLRSRLASNALPAGARGPGSPGPQFPLPDDVTAIEFPYRLLLSPDPDGRWHHRDAPYQGPGGRVELWHTRLAPVPSGPDDRDPTPGSAGMPVRAVSYRRAPYGFGPDGNPRSGNVVSGASTVTRDLRELVTLTSDFSVRTIPGARPYEEWEADWKKSGLDKHPFVPEALQAETMILSSLGASVRIRGDFSYPLPEHDATMLVKLGMPAPSLRQYEHIAGLGRDQFVRIVRRGFVSTGHRATLVKITERRFEPQARAVVGPRGGAEVGYIGTLRQYYRIFIQQPVLDYAGLAEGYPNDGLEMPLRVLELQTLASPKVDLPAGRDGQPIDPDAIENAARLSWWITHNRRWPKGDDEIDLLGRVAEEVETAFTTPFWITAGQTPVPFDYVATDWDGGRVASSLNLMFVPYEAAAGVDKDGVPLPGGQEAATKAVLDAFLTYPGGNEPVPIGFRQSELRGQRMAFANPGHQVPRGSTAAPTETLTFTLYPATRNVKMPATYWLGWLFGVKSAMQHLEPVEAITGQTTVRELRLRAPYLSDGFDPVSNAAGVYAELPAGDPVTLGLDGQRCGAVARPNAVLDVISARQGPLPLAFARQATISPADLAGPLAGARLFGTFSLTDVLGPIESPSLDDYTTSDLTDAELDQRLATGRVRVPILRSRPLFEPGQEARPWGVATRYVWSPALQSTGPGLVRFEFTARSRLILQSSTVTPFDTDHLASTEVRGELRDFELTLAEVVALHFEQLSFLARPGRKPDLSATGARMRFAGDLDFVNTLQDLLPVSGFSDPPAIEVTSAGITAGFSLGVPNVQVGIFALQNLDLSARLSLPFGERPAGVRFALSERHHPFLVTVTLFGGGGFLSLGVSAKGVDEIEAAIEFGGNVALNIGVASGGVYVMAGVYFGKVGDAAKLTGYLRCGGYLDVLGVVSISIEFYLSFTLAHKAGGGTEIWGEASVTVSVKVCGISKSVRLSVEKRFAGSGGDPSLDQVLSEDDWVAYCSAYAAEVEVQ